MSATDFAPVTRVKEISVGAGQRRARRVTTEANARRFMTDEPSGNEVYRKFGEVSAAVQLHEYLSG
jgi:hypothetical protein